MNTISQSVIHLAIQNKMLSTATYSHGTKARYFEGILLTRDEDFHVL